MVSIYETRVINKIMLWTDVPKLWRAKTCAKLEEHGYILNEDGTVTPKPINKPIEDEVAEE